MKLNKIKRMVSLALCAIMVLTGCSNTGEAHP